ncbi:hypothetical protein I553_10340 [Mycobacterium xenopi 4042]|uniref:Mycothiol-dependent maleylpyruvate isomerase metal-binding domain-containing protein n=1 Tax=Mycobacterium xenopi 4042 TaxID=1299334 RepID=X7ZIK0_MYCXE|nr:hypothetical protein I553_10340 [Mycobacterium xenopi 4042]
MPTPCSEFDVAQLTDHLLNSITTIGGVVGAEFPPRDADNSVERQVVAAARPALDSWHRRGLQGTVKLGSTEAPAKAFAGVLSIEFLVHAWDYATATGRDVDARTRWPNTCSSWLERSSRRPVASTPASTTRSTSPLMPARWTG